MENKTKNEDIAVQLKKIKENTFFIDVDILSETEKEKFEKKLKETPEVLA